MKIKSFLLSIFLLLITPIISAQTDSHRDLRIMTFNLRAGSLTTLDSLANVIKSQKPDFVALQEVDVMTQRDNAPTMNGKNMVSELAQRTGMFGFFARTLNFVGGYYGIAILSKHPCTKMENFMLPNPQNTEQRALLKGTFELDGKTPLIFACTHLDVKSAETRSQQVDFIFDKLGDSAVPTIIGGDMNAYPDEITIAKFRRKMSNISGNGLTFPADNPDRKIDYMFFAPKKKCELISTEVIDHNPQPSDHRAIISVIRLK